MSPPYQFSLSPDTRGAPTSQGINGIKVSLQVIELTAYRCMDFPTTRLFLFGDIEKSSTCPTANVSRLVPAKIHMLIAEIINDFLCCLPRLIEKLQISRIGDVCQPTSKTGPALCIIKCYLQLVSRQDWSFPLSASPFQRIASTPAAALLGLFAIP